MGNTASSNRRSLRWRMKKSQIDGKGKRPTVDESSENTNSSGSATSPEYVLKQDSRIPSHAPAALKTIRQWVRHKDEHSIEKMAELTAPGCFFNFKDSQADMPAREFYGAVQDTYNSFPDLHFFWKSMQITGSNDKGTVVVIKDYYGIGRHTGEPYGFGPYEPVPATNIQVKDEDIEFIFTVRDGKITSAIIDAHGKMVGPPGFYTKIGGLII